MKDLIMEKCERRRIKDVRVKRLYELESDHHFVEAKIRLKQEKIKDKSYVEHQKFTNNIRSYMLKISRI